MEALAKALRSKKLTPALIVGAVAVAFSLFHLYTSSAGLLTAVLQRITHLAFAVVLFCLAQIAGQKKKTSLFERITAGTLIICAVLVCVYLFLNFKGFVIRAGAETGLDIFVAALILLMVLEMTRRTTGFILPLITTIALLYCLLGPYMPGLLYHKGVPLKRVLTYMSFGTEGILGTPLGVSATYVALFVIFGAFLNSSGAGDFFIRFTNTLVGRFRGGPAKVAVISSALMGTISGSAAANVVGTGTFTIPMMKKTGYKPIFAGAVEAAASTGGQLMPPIMGAAAFIMAEILGIPYAQVAKAAILPSILYFSAIFFIVDAEALRLGLKGIPAGQLESTKAVVKGGSLLAVPVVVLILALTVTNFTPTRAALVSILSCLIVGLIGTKAKRMSWRDFLEALKSGGEGLVQVAIVCACAGIIVGTLTLTGLGMKLGYILVELSGGLKLPLLLLTAGASLVLGMGVPTTACYIIMATVVAPALTRAGIAPLPAHLFVFYFGILSVVTPPVALAAYAASGISGADPMRTGYAAWRLSLAAYLIPFAFVYGNELLLAGSVVRIILAAISGMTSAYALSGVVTGHFQGRINPVQRLLLLAAALGLIVTELISDVVGYLIVLAMIAYQRSKNRKNGQSVAESKAAL